jgi:hypothetical protein
LLAGQYLVTPSSNDGEFSPDTRSVTLGPNAKNINFTLRFGRLQSVAHNPAGTMTLRVLGGPEKVYVLENSTNLVEWTSLQVIRTDSDGAAEIKHLISTNDSQRYFRLRRR